MAGLQYKFFPTDFFFPPQKFAGRDIATQQQIPLVKSRNTDESDEPKQPKITTINTKAIPSSAASLVPIKKSN
ncbi:Hypothetical predicted protein [Olea europaea subsp. europaea]|uniref:Uncharacterized protein n=1 Tax=Olea europaea subsp. europaea TaxID=158383 RepID=A0A8S0QX88_OLEEU|nr:Hypothetical predicted protein [Olea europaea subsp. europaea]